MLLYLAGKSIVAPSLHVVLLKQPLYMCDSGRRLIKQSALKQKALASMKQCQNSIAHDCHVISTWAA